MFNFFSTVFFAKSCCKLFLLFLCNELFCCKLFYFFFATSFLVATIFYFICATAFGCNYFYFYLCNSFCNKRLLHNLSIFLQLFSCIVCTSSSPLILPERSVLFPYYLTFKKRINDVVLNLLNVCGRHKYKLEKKLLKS